ncbi:peptidase M23/M37 family [Vibrio variabilis]|uniref:Peptidase M23/M37 family n=1 Tax=Vibrio variabilis TaxID=990271 RepID=A0ABQ0JC71_9VIBR|nr:peptidase M23/M37 family [Vibrio variabilis]
MTANQIMELAGIFGWDIDFALDIRSGDYFKLLYQEKVVEGEVIGRGKIIAAIFKNQNDTFTAIFDDKTGNYYDENGRAMKKAFLRAPLDFRRVTSNFNPNRRHPVTGKVRAHRAPIMPLQLVHRFGQQAMVR